MKVLNYIKIIFIITNCLIGIRLTASANETFKIKQGNYHYYSASDIFKCFEVLPHKIGTLAFPIRVVIIKENCSSQMNCNGLEQYGTLFQHENHLIFKLQTGTTIILNSIFMEAQAIYGNRDGVNEVYFYVGNTSFRCSP